MSNECPYCEPVLGGGWGMGPEGWSSMKQEHERYHVTNRPQPSVVTPDFSSGVKPLHARVIELEGYVDMLREAAGIALEAFTLEEDEVRYSPDMWSAMEPLRHAYTMTDV